MPAGANRIWRYGVLAICGSICAAILAIVGSMQAAVAAGEPPPSPEKCTATGQVTSDAGHGRYTCPAGGSTPGPGQQDPTRQNGRTGPVKSYDEQLRDAWNRQGCGAYAEWTPGAHVGEEILARMTEVQYNLATGKGTIDAGFRHRSNEARTREAVYRPSESSARSRHASLGQADAGPDDEIRWIQFTKTCVLADGSVIKLGMFYRQVGPADPGLPYDPAADRRAAYTAEVAKMPESLTLSRSPVGQGDIKGVVNLASWFWQSDWKGQPETATQGPVEVRAIAGELRVDPGDGSVGVQCQLPGGTRHVGSPIAGRDCVHTYSRAGRFNVTATVTWRFSWRVNGEPWRDMPAEDLPERPGQIDQTVVIPYEVSEIQALNGQGG
jgi:hypothetical protein